MSKVEFIYVKGGKKVPMARRYAETLRKLGHGDYSAEAATPLKAEDEGPLVSKEIAAFAEEFKVDLATIVGTGKDGRIKKSDVEAVIASRDLV
jgi:pyruvate/2-oxoglutarate dehydrogenase complex dihydrolipoamide acyltransferase (E2) component